MPKGLGTVVALVLLGAQAVSSPLAAERIAGALAPLSVRHVWLGEPRRGAGEVVVPVHIDDLSEVVAIDLDLRFTAARPTAVQARTTALLAGFMALSNLVGDTLKVAIAGAQPAAGGGPFMEVVTPGEEVPALAFVGVALNGGRIPVEFPGSQEEGTDTAIDA
ncbi:MAG: hypothetical protein AB1505_19895, partial [Candidatus Latescibacterota bacterium]